MKDFKFYLDSAKTMMLAPSLAKRYHAPADLALKLQAADQMGISFHEADTGLYIADTGEMRLKADLAMSLVYRSKLLTAWEMKEVDTLKRGSTGEWEGDYACRITATRENKITMFAEYTSEMAKFDALWVSKEVLIKTQYSGKIAESFWYRNPRRMVQYKCKGMLLRDLFSDVIHQLHLHEEVESIPQAKERSAVTKLDLNKI